jgi:hypothetical protein
MKRSPRLPGTPTVLSRWLHERLNTYALAASAAGVGMLAFSTAVEAKIVYTPAHVIIHRGFPYIVPLDLDHDGATDFNFQNWWGSGSFGPEGFLSVLPVQPANGIWGHATVGSFIHYASALTAGVRVGPKGPFFYAKYNFWMAVSNPSTQGCSGPWNDVKNRYLGLKFTIKGKTHFGWARLNESCNPRNLKISAVLTGYAYETTPNKPIIAGKTKGAGEINSLGQPEATLSAPVSKPATLGLLAMGVPVLSIWRREESVGDTR